MPEEWGLGGSMCAGVRVIKEPDHEFFWKQPITGMSCAWEVQQQEGVKSWA